MKLHKFAAIALLALVVTAGAVVAVPGDAPAGPGADDSGRGASDDARDGEPDREEAGDDRPVDGNEHASAAHGTASAAQAPGSGEALPEQVPDHVARIHDLIRQFLRGSLDGSLGEAVSGVAVADSHSSKNSADASG